MINFFSEGINFKLKNKIACKKWILSTLEEEGIFKNRKFEELSFIFCSDEYLLDMNKKYLSHDYYTDVISFDNSEEKTFSGDIFISVDMVENNAKTYNQRFVDEVHRVMIHGVLHLSGYNDATNSEQEIMRSKEDYYLAKRDFDDNR
ncbi:Endoribonuclease YbeY [bioreactor metagenome]|uniref:Endoribonuclease YbeY n=1 Tax=bioreactor metagenome TaxID=1076179 RepID=A0A645DGD2_9ZZZZ|nr:rRNA maturation RNase YbeY [Rikenellaceae bacterium]